jgi:hypothetical protein
MKSLMASLRTLTLPFGATSGGRIVLDGITGEIRIYNSAGILVLKLNPTDFFAVLDTVGNIRTQMGLLGGTYSIVGFSTGELDQTSGGIVSLLSTGSAVNGANRMVIAPGSRNSKGTLEWTLVSGAANDTAPSILQVVAVSIPNTAVRPIVDLTGARAVDAAHYPDTVVVDLYYGTPAANYGDPPTKVGNYGRGLVGYFINGGNDVARAAGANTNAFVTFNADSARAYEVTFKSQTTVGTAAAIYAVELSVGGTIGGIDGTITDRLARVQPSEVPAGSLSPYVSGSAIYLPAASGSVTLRARNATGSGGTLQLVGTGANQTQMWVKDIGRQ